MPGTDPEAPDDRRDPSTDVDEDGDDPTDRGRTVDDEGPTGSPADDGGRRDPDGTDDAAGSDRDPPTGSTDAESHRQGEPGAVDPESGASAEPTGGGPDPADGSTGGDAADGDDGALQRLHPRSIPYRAITGSLNLGTLIFLGTLIASGQLSTDSFVFIGLVVGGILVSVAYQVAYYARFRYVVTDGSLDITSGVLSRRQREIPLRRIQNVDVGQNLLQRAMGIATVQIETAGGGSTEAQLQYVSPGEAKRLQRVLRGRDVDRAPDATEAGTGTVSGGPASEETVVFELPTRDLLVLSTFTIDRGAGVISSLFAAVMSAGNPTELVWIGQYVSLLPGDNVQRIVSAVVLFALAAWVLSFVITFGKYYGFRLVRTGDELEYERGLVQRYSGTIPMEKIQALSVHENVLKRQVGYATLSVETAGYAPGSEGAAGADAAVPIADRGTVVEIARSIEPFESFEVERPPKRARWRYAVRYLLAVLVLGGVAAGAARFFGVWPPEPEYAAALGVALLTPVAAHLKWRNLGHHAGEDYFVARAGFFKRSTRIVPYYRIQTVVDSRTVFQRRRRLADVTADTASSSRLGGGGATAHDIDEDRADELRATLRERFQESLREHRTRLEAERIESLAEGSASGAGDPDGERAAGGADGSQDSGDLGRDPGDRSTTVDGRDWSDDPGDGQSDDPGDGRDWSDDPDDRPGN